MRGIFTLFAPRPLIGRLGDGSLLLIFRRLLLGLLGMAGAIVVSTPLATAGGGQMEEYAKDDAAVVVPTIKAAAVRRLISCCASACSACDCVRRDCSFFLWLVGGGDI